MLMIWGQYYVVVQKVCFSWIEVISLWAGVIILDQIT